MRFNNFRSSLARSAMVAALAGASLFAPAAEAAVLNGQLIGVNEHSVDTLGNVVDGPTYYATAPGSVSISSSLFLTAIYADQQITVANLAAGTSVTYLTSNFFTGTPFAFNGLHF